jgi:uncharacterized cupin superfamily protein
MSEKVYRFTCDGIGIYEAVEKSCRRDDRRRQQKPDGSWLPKIGENYPGAISFWKKAGFKKYTDSGLRDWHYSVAEGQAKLFIAEKPADVLYEDEFQVICAADAVSIIKEYPFVYEGPRPFQVKETDERPSFLRHHSSLRDWNAYCSYSGSNETFTLMSSIGKDLGLKKIGIHHEILKPNKRSSWPHAHKTEEELVYILKGNPDLWINGRIYSTKAGDAIFFPPGSNLAHTIINNSNEDIEMIVLGEQDAQDDMIYYPHHPDRNAECKKNGHLWENRPIVELGEHIGEPGPVAAREIGSWEYQKNSEQVEEKISGGSDNSLGIFYKTRDLGRTLGAKRVALHRQILPVGFRSSLPHAESQEEEFIFVLKGNPTVWIDGKRYQMNEGDSVAFPSGTGIAHSFINESNSDVELLVSGEMTKSDNKCAFPVNPEEKEFCAIWWVDAPVR